MCFVEVAEWHMTFFKRAIFSAYRTYSIRIEILVIGFESSILVLIVSVQGHCLNILLVLGSY